MPESPSGGLRLRDLYDLYAGAGPEAGKTERTLQRAGDRWKPGASSRGRRSLRSLFPETG